MFTVKPLVLALLTLVSLASIANTLNASEQKQLAKIADVLKEPEQKQQVESKETVAKRMTSQSSMMPQSIVLKGHTAPVVALAKISDTPIAFASADGKGTIKIWNLLGNCFTTISPKKPSPVKAIAGLSDSLVATIASPTTEGIWRLSAADGIITSHVVSFVAEHMPSDKDAITLWDLKTGTALTTGKGLKSSQAIDHNWVTLEPLESEQQFATPQETTFFGYDQSWEAKTGKPLALTTFSIVTPYTFPANEQITAYIWIINKKKLATGWQNGNIRVWEKGAKTQRDGAYVLEGPKGRVTALAALSDNLLASASQDGTIFVWDLTTKKAQIYPGHTKAVRTLLPLSPTQFVSGSDDMTIRVWTLDTSATTAQAQAAQKEKEADMSLHKTTELLNKTKDSPRKN